MPKGNKNGGPGQGHFTIKAGMEPVLRRNEGRRKADSPVMRSNNANRQPRLAAALIAPEYRLHSGFYFFSFSVY